MVTINNLLAYAKVKHGGGEEIDKFIGKKELFKIIYSFNGCRGYSLSQVQALAIKSVIHCIQMHLVDRGDTFKIQRCRFLCHLFEIGRGI